MSDDKAAELKTNAALRSNDKRPLLRRMAEAFVSGELTHISEKARNIKH